VFEKLLVVTRRTRLEELLERHNTRAQARFVLERAGGDYTDYEREHDVYRRALDSLRRAFEGLGPRVQVIDRRFVPTFLFTEKDLVVTVGQDGLVANTAKYVGAQPLVAVNPDPARFDGILLPFGVEHAAGAVRSVLSGEARFREVTLAEATLNDGQRLLAFNDLFVGMKSHVSARYLLRYRESAEQQSSSGVLVATGAGSTGWLSSVFNMARGVAVLSSATAGAPVLAVSAPALTFEDPRLCFVVREPFKSRHSGISLCAGMLERDEDLAVESLMPSGGVIFSDGMEADFLGFSSGTTVRVRAAPQRARLVWR
jgi:NAD kinase